MAWKFRASYGRGIKAREFLARRPGISANGQFISGDGAYGLTLLCKLIQEKFNGDVTEILTPP